MRLGASLLLALLVSCGQPSTPREVHRAPSAVSPAPRAPTSVDSPPGESLFELQPPQPFSAARFRIVSPAPGRRVELAQAPGLEVVVEGSDAALRVALDGQGFRPLQGTTVALGRLLLEDEELAPGVHRVVVVAEGAEGRSLAATWFWVDDATGPALDPPPGPPPPGVVLLSPRGTFHDGAADAVRFEALALASTVYVRDDGQPAASSPTDGAAALELTVSRANRERERALGTASGRGALLATARFDSGDYAVTATRPSQARAVAGPWARVSRIITVNRDSGPVAR